MLESKYISSIKQSHPVFEANPARRLNYFKPYGQYLGSRLKSIKQLEDELWEQIQPNNMHGYSEFQDQAEKARIRWACISSKTQRTFSDSIQIEVYNDVTKVNYHFPGVKGAEPPSRENQPVSGYSKKSHHRLMDKMKRLQKDDLPLPYFVTLTYHRNMTDFQEAKNDLNTFLQRFRRIDREAYYVINPDTGRKNKKWKRLDDFKYIWKMEPQAKNFYKTGRKAIHFHLMFFPPKKIFPEKWKKNKALKTQYMQLRIGTAWNEIAEPGDNLHLQAGTNVRAVENWKMATGYLYKYMKKEVNGHVWKDEPTGRFWGFSYNFCFQKWYRKKYNLEDVEAVKNHIKELQSESYQAYLRHEQSNLERLEKSKKPQSIKAQERAKILARMKKQKRRLAVNLEKIDKGAMVQIELHHQVATQIIP